MKSNNGSNNLYSLFLCFEVKFLKCNNNIIIMIIIITTLTTA